MKLADMVALAKAGYKIKDIQALEEKEEQEAKEKENTPEETIGCTLDELMKG